MDDDRDVAELNQAILIDEGFLVSAIYKKERFDIAAAAQTLEADCLILDGIQLGEEWEGWDVASRLGSGPHPVPVTMLTSDVRSQEEAFVDLSERAKAAAFAKRSDPSEASARSPARRGRPGPRVVPSRSGMGDFQSGRRPIQGLSMALGRSLLRRSVLTRWGSTRATGPVFRPGRPYRLLHDEIARTSDSL